MRRFVFALVPGAVFGAFVALGVQSLGPPPFEAFVGNVAQSLAALREEAPAHPSAQASEAPNAGARPVPAPAGSTGDVAAAAVMASPAGPSSAPSVAARATSDAAEPEVSRPSAANGVDATGVDAQPTALPDAFAEDFAWWGRIDADSSDVPDTESSMAATANPVAEVPDAAPDRSLAAATGEAFADLAASPTEVPEDPVSARASVWIPFHSERSAAGFARRLSRALERPFDVERRGAGRYQVVFAYRDPAERDEIFARVAQITGEGREHATVPATDPGRAAAARAPAGSLGAGRSGRALRRLLRHRGGPARRAAGPARRRRDDGELPRRGTPVRLRTRTA